MKDILLASAAIAGLLLPGCSGSADQSCMIDFSAARQVTVDSTAIDCVLNPAAMAVVDNKLVVANFRSDSIADTFTLPELKHAGSGGVTGNGPGELHNAFAMTMTPYGDNCVCFSNGRGLEVMDVNTFKAIDGITVTMPEGWQLVQSIVPIGKDDYLVQRGNGSLEWAIISREGEIRHSIEPMLPEAFASMKLDDFSTLAVRAGWSTVSPDGKSFAIAYRAFPTIEIYDNDCRLKKSVTAEFTVGERPELWVLAIRSTAKRVYVNLHNPADKGMTESHIVALDWDGSVKGVYAVPMAVGPFAVDDKDSRLYFYPAGDHDSIYSFAL